MKLIHFFVLVLPVLTSVPTVNAGSDIHSIQTQTGSVKTVSVTEFEKLIKTEGTLVDVRTNREAGEGIIEGALVIDFLGLNFEKEIVKLDKTKPVFIYCLSGARSENASEKLVESGYTVYNLEGGVEAWKAAGKPLVKPVKK